MRSEATAGTAAWATPGLPCGSRGAASATAVIPPSRKKAVPPRARHAFLEGVTVRGILVEEANAGAAFAGPADLGSGAAALDDPQLDDFAFTEPVARLDLTAPVRKIVNADVGITARTQRESTQTDGPTLGASDESLRVHVDCPPSD